MKRVLGLGLCILLLMQACMISYAEQAATKESVVPEELQKLYATSACLIDGESGRVLFSKNGREKLPMASTTKIMTLIVALENGNLDDLVTISDYAGKQPNVQLNARSGEQYYLKDLLYSLMLESHNDSAVAIAEHVGGTVEGFANLMNQKARDLGLKDTFFITPNGLDAVATDQKGLEYQHSTTAIDLAAIMKYCISESPTKDKFLEITRTENYSFTNQKVNDSGIISPGGRRFSCQNHNAFLNMMEGALSGKTGFTGKAGYCYVGALQKDGRTFIVALLACGWPNHKTYKWSDTRSLMTYGLDHYQYRAFDQSVVDQSALKSVIVQNGQTEEIGETAVTNLKIKDSGKDIPAQKAEGLLMREEENIEVKVTIPKQLEAPVKYGEIVGSVQYFVDGEVWKQNVIIIGKSIEKIDFEWCFRKLLWRFSL